MNKQVSQVGVVALVLLSPSSSARPTGRRGRTRASPTGRTTTIRLVAQFHDRPREDLRRRRPDGACDEREEEGRAGRRSTSAAIRPGRSSPTSSATRRRSRNRTGLEQSYNDYLTGSNANLDTVFRSTLDKLKGTTVTGNDLVLTIRPGLQALALRLLRGKCGAVVALDPATGRVLAMATSPTYNPNLIEKPLRHRRRARTCRCGRTAPQPRYGRQYPPGSTFKMVTAAAALDTGRFTPDSRFYDPGYCEEYGKQVPQRRQPGSAGDVRPRQPRRRASSTRSTPSSATSARLRRRRPSSTTRSASASTRCRRSSSRRTSVWRAGLRPRQASSTRSIRTRRSIRAGSRSARSGSQVTPLQMAMVAATIANHGVRDAAAVVERDRLAGRQDDHAPAARPARPPIKRQTADELTRMMELAVREAPAPPRADPGDSSRRQDRHGGDRSRRTSTRPGSSPSRRRTQPKIADRGRRSRTSSAASAARWPRRSRNS